MVGSADRLLAKESLENGKSTKIDIVNTDRLFGTTGGYGIQSDAKRSVEGEWTRGSVCGLYGERLGQWRDLRGWRDD